MIVRTSLSAWRGAALSLATLEGTTAEEHSKNFLRVYITFILSPMIAHLLPTRRIRIGALLFARHIVVLALL